MIRCSKSFIDSGSALGNPTEKPNGLKIGELARHFTCRYTGNILFKYQQIVRV